MIPAPAAAVILVYMCISCLGRKREIKLFSSFYFIMTEPYLLEIPKECLIFILINKALKKVIWRNKSVLNKRSADVQVTGQEKKYPCNYISFTCTPISVALWIVLSTQLHCTIWSSKLVGNKLGTRKRHFGKLCSLRIAVTKVTKYMAVNDSSYSILISAGIL